MRKHLSKISKKGEELFCKAWQATAKPLFTASASEEAKCKKPLCPAGLFELADLPCGVCVLVKKLQLSPEKAESLRRMGIREGSKLSLMSSNDPMIVAVDNSRIAVSQSLACHIQVEPAQ